MSNARELAELGGSYGTGGFVGMKNRIINGAMVIDQRNAGASVTNGFAVDRFEFQENSGAAFTVQRSTTVPTGFSNSLVTTVTPTAASATAAQVNRLFQRIEGNNIADFGWGAAGASTVTLSFWVRSSLTGTYCIGLVNNAANRSYVAEYTINSANTWEYKTITVAGDTSGTWETGTSSGVQVTFDLGGGSNYNTTAGVWAAGNYTRTTNQANFANTLNATFYITGVQLEKGSTATSFDYRPIGTELALCQRYYEKSYNIETAPGTVGSTGARSASNAAAFGSTTRSFILNNQFLVAKRTIPNTVTLYDPFVSNGSGKISGYSSAIQYTVSGVSSTGALSLGTYITTTTAPSQTEISNFHFTADSEL